ncbi:hypothetical protein ACFQZZ_23415 [Nocardia sp. GCM10030253]|uniref:hypothetical protein n=1 Tax=Nocardia sp. GCM10030253 TaxID=3273404 RepID=UPI00362D0BEE
MLSTVRELPADQFSAAEPLGGRPARQPATDRSRGALSTPRWPPLTWDGRWLVAQPAQRVTVLD